MSSGLSARRLRRLHDVMAGHVEHGEVFFETHGWGFGVAVVTHRDDLSATPGRYFWDGGYGTSWASDPTEDLIGILMTGRMGFPTLSKRYLDFWTGAYQAIDD
jgi:CubicO group peptidase (beta-lactamase class C family)